jgi:hypothetical protein
MKATDAYTDSTFKIHRYSAGFPMKPGAQQVFRCKADDREPARLHRGHDLGETLATLLQVALRQPRRAAIAELLSTAATPSAFGTRRNRRDVRLGRHRH